MYKKIAGFPFFPFLFVLTFVLVFYFTFYEAALLGSVIVTIIFALLLLFLVWGIFFILIKDISKSAVITFICSLGIYYFQSLVSQLSTASQSLGFIDANSFWLQRIGQWLAFFIFLVIITMIFLLVRQTKRIRPIITQTLNLFGILVFAIVTARGAISIYQKKPFKESFNSFWVEEQMSRVQPTVTDREILPDVYYIILDGFGRSDTLDRLYGLDNSEFIKELQKRGVFVAEESYANYTQTRTSLASSMNMMYLDGIARELGENKSFSYPTYLMIDNSVVEKNFRELGYELVGFESEMGFLSFKDWDLFYMQKLIPDNYSRAFMNSTIASVFMNGKMYDWHRKEIDYTLRTIPSVESGDKPRFIFAHVLCPHPPFVYTDIGSEREASYLYMSVDGNTLINTINDLGYRTGYADQVNYIQSRLLELIDQIILSQTRPLIVIVQGDHGPGLDFNHESLEKSDVKERLGIFNAYYFYDQDYKNLYPEISPVNTFRVIFSQYFEMNYPLLDERHFYSTYNGLFDFVQVDERLN